MANSKRKCTSCKAYFKPDREFGPVAWCSEACMREIARKAAERARKQGERERRKWQRERKKENARQKREFYEKDIKTRREAAIKYFNRFIRLRDGGLPCISCGNSNPGIKYDAGHYVPAGSCSALRFNEYNVNLQCSLNCNQHLSGNRSNYRKGLLEKYGRGIVEFLEGPQPTIKITVEWYKEIEETYKAKCKQLEQEKAA